MNTPKYTPTPALSRRKLLAGGAAGLFSAGLAGCGGSSSSGGLTKGGSGKLQITMFAFLGGDLAVMPKEFAKEYSESHPNVEVTVYEDSNSVGYGKMLAQRQADPSQPLVNMGFFNAETTEQGAGDKMWNELDYSSLPNATNISEQFRREDQLGIGIGADQYGLVTNTDTVSTPPDSWEALWADEQFKDSLSFFNFPWYAVYMAAKLNGGGLEDMEPGWQVWKDHADRIKLVVESNPQYLNVMSNGTTPLTAYFNGTSHQWISSGAPLEYTVPAEGVIPVPVYLQTVAGQSDDQLEVCNDMLNEMLAPKWSKRWIETSIQVPANTETEMPDEFSDLPAFQPSTIENFLDIDYGIVGREKVAWEERWKTEILPLI